MKKLVCLLFLFNIGTQLHAQLAISAGSDNSDIIESSSFNYFRKLNGWQEVYSKGGVYTKWYNDEYYLIGSDFPLNHLNTVFKTVGSVDLKKNFEISTSIKPKYIKEDLQTEFISGVIFGKSTMSNCFYFIINNNNQFKIVYGDVNGNSTLLTDWEYSKYIGLGVNGFNDCKLSIEKSNKLLVFKINNNNIFTYNVPSNFEFKTIGFPINGGTEYIVDYINILYK